VETKRSDKPTENKPTKIKLSESSLKPIDNQITEADPIEE
jgi:hypothetical protein